MTDVAALSDDELTTLRLDVEAERQKRNTRQRLMDQAWNLVQDAKNAGYTKAQVGKVLTDVVNESYA